MAESMSEELNKELFIYEMEKKPEMCNVGNS